MSLDLSLLPDGGLGWLDASGTHADVVISTRVRLARNVAGYAFTGRARDGERLRLLAQVRDAVSRVSALEGAVLVRLDDLATQDRQLLHERHLVSKELAGIDAAHGVRSGAAVLLGDSMGVMINEEDHLRLQAVRSGFAVEGAFQAAMQLDRDLGRQLPYSWHKEFGFLTACPTNTGTGMRASVLIHLPGLVLTKEISKLLAGLQAMGLTYRGLYGEGSEVVGNFFQLSNQKTLGSSEEALQDHLTNVVRHVIERELEARRILQRDAGYIIEDKLWRAYGTLRYARSLSFDEAMNYLSGVRLAVGMKLIPELSVYTLNTLLIHSQLAHLAVREGRSLGESEANLARARYVRGVLSRERGNEGGTAGSGTDTVA
jgi:protein arginine kinase